MQAHAGQKLETMSRIYLCIIADAPVPFLFRDCVPPGQALAHPRPATENISAFPLDSESASR
jgi:hypothetical protein